MTDDRRQAALDMAEQLYAEMTAAWSRAKEHADALQAMRDMAKYLAAVLRDNGEPT
jgi:hypothetical protein